MEKVDDDLRPIIMLEEEDIATWVMVGIILPSPPGFLVFTPPRARVQYFFLRSAPEREDYFDCSSVREHASVHR